MTLLILAGGLFIAALIYNKLKGRSWGHALHYATIFAIAITLFAFVGFQIAAILGFVPTNRQVMGG
ncbi:MAG: hypothetical protein MRY63_13975 [Neomegalonema sp.]|nr:hypothetical protein [Neomegalonema sp.]